MCSFRFFTLAYPHAVVLCPRSPGQARWSQKAAAYVTKCCFSRVKFCLPLAFILSIDLPIFDEQNKWITVKPFVEGCDRHDWGTRSIRCDNASSNCGFPWRVSHYRHRRRDNAVTRCRTRVQRQKKVVQARSRRCFLNGGECMFEASRKRECRLPEQNFVSKALESSSNGTGGVRCRRTLLSSRR